MKHLITTILCAGSLISYAQWDHTTYYPHVFYNTGNVGIGLTNPQYGLSLYSYENQTVLGGNTKSVLRLMNGYAEAFGRRSEIQFGLTQNNNELLAVTRCRIFCLERGCGRRSGIRNNTNRFIRRVRKNEDQ